MTRMADQLGTGSSFARARGGVSARRQAVAAATGTATVGTGDSRLQALPLAQLVPTRFNPRRNFGTETDQRGFGLRLKKKQLQPAVAVTRDAYLELWPDEAENIGGALYVIANGERRWRGARAADLPTLDVVVDDEVAKSRADFLDAVLAENNDREDLDPVERALGIKTMVEELGGKAQVAEYYEKSPGWVTQQMYLLDLAAELQDLVSSGELPLRETRELAKLPLQEQAKAWEARKAEREQQQAQPKKRRTKQPSHDTETNKKNAGSTAAKPESDPERPLTLPHQSASDTTGTPHRDTTPEEALIELGQLTSLAGKLAEEMRGLPTAYEAAARHSPSGAGELMVELQQHLEDAIHRLPSDS